MGKLKDMLNKIIKKGDSEEIKEKIRERSAEAEIGSPEWVALRAALEQEIKIENMKKEKGFLGISRDRWFGAGLVIVGLAVTMMWDHDSPMAIKLTKLVYDRVRGT